MSLADSVKNGPRATNAKVAHIEAQIRVHEARAKQAQDAAAAHRRRAAGDGPLAKSRRIRAEAQTVVADRHRAKANELRTDLATAKADEAARHVKHVKRTVASTADEGLTPQVPSQPGPAKPTQAKKGGQPVVRRQSKEAKEAGEWAAREIAEGRQLVGVREPATKGTPAMTVSGEAVNIEQTEASLNQLKSQVGDLRGSFENMAGSLSSGGLNKLAGSFATADDGLAGVLTEITAAEKHLADQRGIAEAAQAAGEMHTDTSFYG